MKLQKLTRCALLFFTLTAIITNINCMEPIEPQKTTQKKKSRMKRFANRVGTILLGKNREASEEIIFTEFADLPSDIQNYIMTLLTINSSAATLHEAARTINALAQVNTELNTKINSPGFTIQMIDNLSHRFSVSPEEAATTLATKGAQDYLTKQLTHKNFLYLQYARLSNKNINVNVADEHGNTPLMIAIKHLYQNAIDALLANKNINTSLQNNDGNTIFHVALYRLNKATTDQEYTQINQIIPNLLQKQKHHSNLINAQNKNGDTPLHVILTTLQHPKNAHKTMIATDIASMLIDNGAHAGIKNNAHVSGNDLLENINDHYVRDTLKSRITAGALNQLGL